MTPERIAFLRDIVAERAATHGKAWTGPHGESLLQSADAIRELCAHLDTLTAERNTLLDRVDRLTAALARKQKERRAEVDTLTAERDELAATIANERGEGEPPGEWWTFIDGAWRHRIGVVYHKPTGGWTWSAYLDSDDTLIGPAPTAREGMRLCMAERARLDALAERAADAAEPR